MAAAGSFLLVINRLYIAISKWLPVVVTVFALSHRKRDLAPVDRWTLKPESQTNNTKQLTAFDPAVHWPGSG